MASTLATARAAFSMAVLACGLSACSPMNASLLESYTLTKAEDAVDKADALSCLATQPDYELQTKIVSFEMTGGANAKVGFNGLGGILSAIGLGGSYSSGTLTMAMHLSEPAKMTGMSLLDANGKSQFSRMTFNASFDVWLAGLDIGTYTQTPLAGLSAEAVQSTLSTLVTSLRASGLENPWSTHISKVKNATEYMIPVGKNAGLKIGDELKIYNVEYEWDGAPCASPMLMARRLTDEPIALVVVAQVDTESAYVRVTKKLSEDAVQKYAVAMVSKLIQPTEQGAVARTADSLARSIRIGSVSASQKLRFQTTTGTYQDVDLTPFITEQITSIARDPNYGGFYLKK